MCMNLAVKNWFGPIKYAIKFEKTQVFGQRSSTRALPIARKGELYFSETVESGSTEHKRVSLTMDAKHTNPSML